MDYGKHFKERMTQAEIDSALMAKMEADEREIARLRADLDEQCRLLGAGSEREARLMAQLAAAQAHIEKLQKALKDERALRRGYSLRAGLPIHSSADEALALPHDDTALKERLAKERERCALVADVTVCDTHLPTGVRVFGSRAADAIRAMGYE